MNQNSQKFIVEYQQTPNPHTLKFYPVGYDVCPGRMLEFRNDGYFINSALARDLLEIPEIESVFYGNDFISVTKKENELVKWEDLRAEIIFVILKYEKEIIEQKLLDSYESSGENEDDDFIEYDEKDQETVEQICELLNEDIRPRVAMDGGDIQLKAFKNGIAYLKLRGACSSCPSSSVTLYSYVREFLVANIDSLIDIERI